MANTSLSCKVNTYPLSNVNTSNKGLRFGPPEHDPKQVNL